MNDTNLIELFCILDDFCKYFTLLLKKHQIDIPGKRRRNRPCVMNDSEIMLILIMYTQNLFEALFIDNVHLITKLRKNMKNSMMLLRDRIMLRKRSIIETVNDELKNVCHIEHTRHRSIDNFVTNLIVALIVYQLMPKKPTMNIEIIDKSRLIA